jgi:transcriptional antiterminator Rof (Rho-off)
MTDMAEPYVSIACAAHDRLELAVMRGQHLRIRWQDPDDTLNERVLRPLDLKTQSGEEFLIAEIAGGSRVSLRLDRIDEVMPING